MISDTLKIVKLLLFPYNELFPLIYTRQLYTLSTIMVDLVLVDSKDHEYERFNGNCHYEKRDVIFLLIREKSLKNDQKK
jgi:hypothetical protein